MISSCGFCICTKMYNNFSTKEEKKKKIAELSHQYFYNSSSKLWADILSKEANVAGSQPNAKWLS